MIGHVLERTITLNLDGPFPTWDDRARFVFETVTEHYRYRCLYCGQKSHPVKPAPGSEHARSIERQVRERERGEEPVDERPCTGCRRAPERCICL